MTVAVPERAPARRGEFHILTVADVDRLCDDAVAVRFAVPDDLREAYDFEAGQSLTLRRVVDGREERRSYSICAPVGGRPRIGVREIPGGLFSRWLVREVRPGDEIEVQTPTGRFCPDPAILRSGGRHLCIAAGSGITPMLSVVGTALGYPEAPADTSVALVYGNRTTSSVMFAEELADLKNRFGPRLQLLHVLSREPRDVELFSGRLDADRLRRLLDVLLPADSFDHVWLCGPHQLIEAARGVLTDAGVRPERIHFELFYVDEPPPEPRRRTSAPTGQTSEVTVVLDGVTATAPMSRDEAVLDSAGRLRSDLPFACKGGVCGTCRARVTDGKVEMRRNYALEQAEVDAGFVLTCQSYPVSAAVTVDYDA